MIKEKITIQAIVEIEPKKVWNYYTQPEHIMKWNFADSSWHCPKALNDLRVGGRYFARMEAKDGSFGFDFVAIYTEVLERKKIVYEFGDRQATIEFKEQGGGTKITISFDAETENSIELQKNGWQAILNQFKKYAETNVT